MAAESGPASANSTKAHARPDPAANVTAVLTTRYFSFSDLASAWNRSRADAAAERLGFTYEGTFRQHMIVKGQNRDTAWFSMLDGEWPAVDAAFQRWMAPENTTPDGTQRQSLAAIRGS